MANITDITNPTTTVGAITRGVEIGLELVGFGLLCGIKKDTKEIRKTESDILAKARNIESVAKATETNTTSVLNWIRKVDPVIMGTSAEQTAQAQQAVQQTPAQQAPAQQPAFTQADIDAAVQAALAKKETSAPNITNIVNGGDAGKETPAQPTFTQADIDAAVAKANAASAENMKTQINAAAEAAAKTAVEQYIASQQQTDANKGNGKK